MLGMHGTYEANMSMQHCDVLLAVGARFDDRVIGNPRHFASVERKIIHVDIDPSSISKRVKVDIPIVGDWNNSGKDKLGVYRKGGVFLDVDGSRHWSLTEEKGDATYRFGNATDRPIVGA